MIVHEELQTDDYGQVIGVSHHDGSICALRLGDGKKIDLLIISADGQETEITLLGVEYFFLNNLREGNIIDRMYSWPLAKAPPLIMKRILKGLSIASEDFFDKKLGERLFIFHLECSYGAELFALVQDAQAITSSSRISTSSRP